MGGVKANIVDKITVEFGSVGGDNNSVADLMFFTPGRQFYFKHGFDYTLFSSFLVALAEAISAAFCFDLPLPVAISFSPKKTPTLNIF